MPTLLAVLLAFQSAAAQAPAPKAPTLTAEEIVERSIEATGGRDARQKMTSTIAKGTLEIPAQGGQAPMEFYAKAPNKRFFMTSVDGFGDIKQGFDGEVAWSERPDQGLRVLEGVELAQAKREASFNAELKWREIYKKVELKGKEKVNNREAYVVELTPDSGRPLTRYYDVESFLLLRQDSVQETPQGPVSVQALMSDYRDVGGIKVPFRVEQRAAEQTVIIIVTEVQNNVEIDDARFAKPAAK
ncbi:MAG: hypothetical protein AAB225_03430 [Acidobacteriota bacterium]